ncbi:zinc knuckle CX2CX4HX4C containing protein, partial [Tanacetum coccineum]
SWLIRRVPSKRWVSSHRGRLVIRRRAKSNEESIEGADVAIPLAAVDDVKLHNVPIVAYSKVGLSLITTKLERPIMLDAYTSTICLKSWGRTTYARALIEVSSKKALMDSLVMAIPFQNGSGHSMETIKIEYEWQPPCCDTCKIFDHIDDQCPKKVKVVVPTQESDDGFVEVTHHKEAASQSNAFSALEEDNRNPMDDLVDETRKKVKVPPKKTLRLTGIWSGRKANSPKRNIVLSPETKVHCFNRDDTEFDDMDQAAEGWEHENAYSDNG